MPIPVESFATLPFSEQLARIEAAAQDEGELATILREAGSLPDSEPLARLIVVLAESGRLDAALQREIAEIARNLPDPALQHLLAQGEPGSRTEAALRVVVEEGLHAWPIERISALALFSRWLRRRFPEAHRDFVKVAEQQTTVEPRSARWLLFVGGERLVELLQDRSWEPLVREASSRAIDSLARAPKSISQANAESLLARRVYADPGHFFFELLQNADDAVADRWRATVGADSVTIEHNGAPFSFHDLVGLLSIGQTTKRVEQIGFFGVGFKSVYEICDRPRIHSGVFDVEVAHVSIPRSISTRPKEADNGNTVLVLPYSRRVEVADLHRKACAIPPETLLTLSNVHSMEVATSDGPTWSWKEEWQGDTATLFRSGSDEARRYLCIRETFSFSGGREEGRAHTSPLLIAVSLDSQGRPQPVRGPTIYAFLPTAEHTGLRCIVHARFDVTLDRERLEQGSEWNQALLKAAGYGLAKVVKALVGSGVSPLPVLSSPDELAPVSKPLMDALAADLRDHPCLLGADGAKIRPFEARIVAKPLAGALAGLDLGNGAHALAPLSNREQSVALFLGATELTDADLVAFVARALREGSPPPAWLDDVVLAALGDARVPDAEIRALPLVRDASSNLVRLDKALVASAEWAALYVSIKPVVDVRVADALPASLRSRTAIIQFDPAVLVDDLRDPALQSRLFDREDLLLHAISTLPMRGVELLSALPVLRTTRGERRSIQEGIRRLSPALQSIETLLAKRAHLLAPDLAARFGVLVRNWVPEFGFSDLVELLRSSALENDEAEAVLDVLDEAAGAMGHDLVHAFSRTTIFNDVHGLRRPLLGPSRALLPSDEDLLRVLPGWPWLANTKRRFVRAANVSSANAATIVAALVDNEGGYPTATVPTPDLLDWIAKHADELPNAAIDRLANAPVWLDADGKPVRLDSLRREGGPEHVSAFYREVDIRRVAHRASERLASAVRIGDRLPASNTKLIVSDLLALGGAPDVSRAVLADVLNAAVDDLAPSELHPILQLPIFRDQTGVERPVASWRESNPLACHRAGSLRSILVAGKLPLLHDEDENLFAKFLHAVGPSPATVSDVVRCAASDPGLIADPRVLREALVAHADHLDEEARVALQMLPLFTDCRGNERRIGDLCSRRDVLAFLEEGDVDLLGVDDKLLHAEQDDLVTRLGLARRPVSELLQHDVLVHLKARSALHEQRPPWNSRHALVRLLRGVVAAGIDPTEATLVVDAQGRTKRGPISTADERTRALVKHLPLAEQLADFEWSSLVPEALGHGLLVPLSVRQVAEALRIACPNEVPLVEHPIIDEPQTLYAWLLENRDALSNDDAALSALAAASIVPSQKGTLRAPKDLVLDPSVPDLGLDWGISRDVPPELASWLATTFQLDRRQRRAIVEHVLNGIDAAARGDECTRATELVAFLARALGAGEVEERELEERVRFSDVRARLKVPVANGEWKKPKHAWLARDEEAMHVEVFCVRPPPRIKLAPIDEPSRALLVACGAIEALDDKTVLSCIAGDLLREGDAARRSLARYVVLRVLESPKLRREWGLDDRAWVPDRTGGLKRPRDLVWPDDLARSLLGASSERFPESEVVLDLADEAGATLGFQLTSTLSLSDVARLVGGREGTVALLDWLEEGLKASRFAANDVRSSFIDELLVRDAEGMLRPPRELARDGGHALFGWRRGDWPDADRFPRLTRALGIPREPNPEMILAFLDDVSAGTDASEKTDDLREILPRCYEKLGEVAEGRDDIRLREGVIVAGVRDGAIVLARATDSDVRVFDPRGIAATLPDAVARGFIELLPTAAAGSTLSNLLLEAGVRDLWSDFEVREVAAGPEQPALREAGKDLQAMLAEALGERMSLDVKVVDPLSVSGVIESARATSGYRDAEHRISTEVDAIIHGRTLYLTPSAIARPELVAPALEQDPVRRVAMARWLAKRDRSSLPRRLKAKTTEERLSDSEDSIFDRVRSLFRRDTKQTTQPPPSRPPTSARSSSRSTIARRGEQIQIKSFDENLFRPRSELKSQLGFSESWLERRTQQPEFGFAFTPETISAPWLYAPNLITIDFDQRGQSWRRARLERPPSSSSAGIIVFRGLLPEGEAVLPVPMFGHIEQLTVDGEPVLPGPGPSGGQLLRLTEPADVRFRVSLDRVPDLERAVPSPIENALASFVPEEELPEEVLEFLVGLDPNAPAITRAFSIRDFIREHYRYDPSYLEDAGVARWLTRLAVGRANAHIAALHAARDGKHLGAGVCYELNTLACELLRRAGVPAAIATGWVLEGGALSEPDHLWCIALLHDARGVPLWVPIDASSTRNGRPLRVPRRPPGRFRAPKDPRAKAPEPPKWNLGAGQPTGRSQAQQGGQSRKRRKRPPRAELLRVIHHLEKVAGRKLEERERAELEKALEDPNAAARLLDRLAK